MCVCVLQTDVAAAQFAINLSGAGDLLSSSWSHILLQFWACSCCHLLEKIRLSRIKWLSNGSTAPNCVVYCRQLDFSQFLGDLSPLIQEESLILTNSRDLFFSQRIIGTRVLPKGNKTRWSCESYTTPYQTALFSVLLLSFPVTSSRHPMNVNATWNAKCISIFVFSSRQTLKARRAPTRLPRRQRSWRRTADWCESRRRKRSSSGYRGRKRRSKICWKLSMWMWHTAYTWSIQKVPSLTIWWVLKDDWCS